MKRILILFVGIVFLVGCGHTAIQKSYMKAQRKVAMLKVQRAQEPLVTLKTPSGCTLTVKDPRQASIAINPPTKHPVVSVWEDTVSLASSPLASILGFGYAGKLLMEEAGAEYSAGGDIAGRDVIKPGGDMADGDISGGDMADGNMAGSDLSGENMDKSDRRSNYGNDQSDNRRDYNNDKSDRRSNYGNDQFDQRSNYRNDQFDQRSNYRNDNSVIETTGDNGE